MSTLSHRQHMLVNQHMENSICFVVFIFESFPKFSYGMWIVPDGVVINYQYVNDCFICIIRY